MGQHRQGTRQIEHSLLHAATFEIAMHIHSDLSRKTYTVEVWRPGWNFPELIAQSDDWRGIEAKWEACQGDYPDAELLLANGSSVLRIRRSLYVLKRA